MIDRTPDYDDILNACLDSVFSGQQTIDECLQAHPEHAHLLKPALQIALLTRQLQSSEMPANRVNALEMRLRGQMLAAHQTRPAAVRPSPSRRSAFAPLSKLAAMIAIVFLFALGTGGGAVAASASSLPGDPLYGLKRLWESIILVLASLGDSVDDVWLHLAQTRLDEAEMLAERGTLNSGVFVDVYQATVQAITLADQQTTPLVVAFLSDAGKRLQDIPTTAATEPLRQDLLLLMIAQPGPTGQLSVPLSSSPPSLQPTMMVVQSPIPSDTAGPTVTSTPILSPTITNTASPTATNTKAATATPVGVFLLGATFTPTSRVSATSTDTPPPTSTRTPTVTPSYTPTATWTPIPLPAVTMTGSQVSRPPVGGSDHPPTDDSGQVDPAATVRFRATQGAVYATQTKQAAMQTEEPVP